MVKISCSPTRNGNEKVFLNAPRRAHGVGDMVDPSSRIGELVAAEARDGVGRRAAGAQTVGDRDQKLVAERMSEESLTTLKRSRSRKRTANGRRGWRAALDRVLEAVHEQRAVRQIGQRVVKRVVRQPLGRRACVR